MLCVAIYGAVSCPAWHSPTAECATADECAIQAQSLLASWMLGFERGPHNETTGADYRRCTFPQGRTLASRAVTLGPRSSAAAVANSTALLLDFEWEAAAAEARRALALNRSDAGAWSWLSKVQTALLDLDGALRSSETAEGLASSPDAAKGLAIATGAVLYMRREFAALRDRMSRIVADDASYVAAWDWLAMAYNGLGQYDQALAAYSRALELAPNDMSYPITELLASKAHTYAVAGRTAQARVMLGQLYDTAGRRYVEPVRIWCPNRRSSRALRILKHASLLILRAQFRLAFVEAALNATQRAVDRLSDALALKQWELAFMRTEPWLDPLRGSAAFDRIVAQVGFPPPVQPCSDVSCIMSEGAGKPES